MKCSTSPSSYGSSSVARKRHRSGSRLHNAVRRPEPIDLLHVPAGARLVGQIEPLGDYAIGGASGQGQPLVGYGGVRGSVSEGNVPLWC
jgi:hypothetical protein